MFRHWLWTIGQPRIGITFVAVGMAVASGATPVRSAETDQPIEYQWRAGQEHYFDLRGVIESEDHHAFLTVSVIVSVRSVYDNRVTVKYSRRINNTEYERGRPVRDRRRPGRRGEPRPPFTEIDDADHVLDLSHGGDVRKVQGAEALFLRPGLFSRLMFAPLPPPGEESSSSERRVPVKVDFSGPLSAELLQQRMRHGGRWRPVRGSPMRSLRLRMDATVSEQHEVTKENSHPVVQTDYRLATSFTWKEKPLRVLDGTRRVVFDTELGAPRKITIDLRIHTGLPGNRYVTHAKIELERRDRGKAGQKVSREIEERIGRLDGTAAAEIGQAVSWFAENTPEEAGRRLLEAEAIAELKEQAAERLAAIVRDGPSAAVRAAALRALRNWGIEGHLPALRDAVTDSAQRVRQRAVSVLVAEREALSGEAVTTLLANVLRNEARPELRRVAAEGLGKLGDEEGRSALVAALEDEAATVRRTAARALAKGTPVLTEASADRFEPLGGEVIVRGLEQPGGELGLAATSEHVYWRADDGLRRAAPGGGAIARLRMGAEELRGLGREDDWLYYTRNDQLWRARVGEEEKKEALGDLEIDDPQGVTVMGERIYIAGNDGLLAVERGGEARSEQVPWVKKDIGAVGSAGGVLYWLTRDGTLRCARPGTRVVHEVVWGLNAKAIAVGGEHLYWVTEEDELKRAKRPACPAGDGSSENPPSAADNDDG